MHLFTCIKLSFRVAREEIKNTVTLRKRFDYQGSPDCNFMLITIPLTCLSFLESLEWYLIGVK